MLDKEALCEKLEQAEQKIPVGIPEVISYGDMPGDKIEIKEAYLSKAITVFKELIQLAKNTVKETNRNKLVIAVCGGSGVGKSVTATLLSGYFAAAGIKSYTLSGDNYPHRIPRYNDAERLSVFRNSALLGMIRANQYNQERAKIIKQYQEADIDADNNIARDYPWYQTYLDAGRRGLTEYLGTTDEINFAQLEQIITQFKQGAESIWLKRMGRELSQLWYEEVDMSDVNVIIIEWTHGNSDYYTGVDIPVLLNSTPEETLAHRKARNRDGGADSPFTTMVLEIEQGLLHNQAQKAKLIVSRQEEILSYEQYQKHMATI